MEAVARGGAALRRIMTGLKPRERRRLRRLGCVQRFARRHWLRFIRSLAQCARDKAPDQRCGEQRNQHPDDKGDVQPVREMNGVHNRPASAVLVRTANLTICRLILCKSSGNARFDGVTPPFFTVFFRGCHRLMEKIALLPLSEHARFGALFERSIYAEGSYVWFELLAETTLGPGEAAVVAVAFEDGAAKAALPLVRKGAQMRALTAPYTTIYAPALFDPKWTRFLGANAQRYIAGSLQLDALDPADAGVAAYLDGVASSGLIAAQYRHFVNCYEPIGDFEDYWNARPSRLKATVRRKLAQARALQADFRCYRQSFGEAVAIYEAHLSGVLETVRAASALRRGDGGQAGTPGVRTPGHHDARRETSRRPNLARLRAQSHDLQACPSARRRQPFAGDPIDPLDDGDACS